METPSPQQCRLDLVPSLADRFVFGVNPIDYGPVLLLRPFGFHLTADTLSSPIFIGAGEALPPPLDMALSIREPEGLQPS